MIHASRTAPASVRGLAVLLVLAIGAAAAPRDGIASAQAAAAEITYTMPAGWVAQALQGGPELKAHYVLMSGGRPYGEMFLTQTALPVGQPLDAIFEEGLSRLRPQMPYYQARGTQRTTVAGRPAIQHDFVFMPSGAGVMFSGRSYTLAADDSVFTFYFQTVSSYAASVQASVAQAMATVKLVPKPVAPATNPAAIPPAANRPDRAAVRPDGSLAAEDMGLAFTLPAGWRQEDDPQGAKYRYYGPGGAPWASLFILEPEKTDGLAALFGGTEDDTLDMALSSKIDREYKTYDRYAPVATAKRKVAGREGRVHDFTFQINGRPVFYRWTIFLVPGRSADPTIQVAPTVQPFAFLTTEPARADELKRQWDAIVDSMRPRTADRPAPPIPAADAPIQAPPAPPIKPADKAEGELPDLQPEAPEAAGIYAEPFGRYRVALPEGAVQEKIEDHAAFYRMPAPRTAFIIHSFRQEDVGARLAARFAEGRKPNGLPSLMSAGGRNVSVSLYTARDEGGESLAWVVALYPGSGLLIVISLPAKDYPAAKGWIQALLRGVSFGP